MEKDDSFHQKLVGEVRAEKARQKALLNRQKHALETEGEAGAEEDLSLRVAQVRRKDIIRAMARVLESPENKVEEYILRLQGFFATDIERKASHFYSPAFCIIALLACIQLYRRSLMLEPARLQTARERALHGRTSTVDAREMAIEITDDVLQRSAGRKTSVAGMTSDRLLTDGSLGDNEVTAGPSSSASQRARPDIAGTTPPPPPHQPTSAEPPGTSAFSGQPMPELHFKQG